MEDLNILISRAKRYRVEADGFQERVNDALVEGDFASANLHFRRVLECSGLSHRMLAEYGRRVGAGGVSMGVCSELCDPLSCFSALDSEGRPMSSGGGFVERGDWEEVVSRLEEGHKLYVEMVEKLGSRVEVLEGARGRVKSFSEMVEDEEAYSKARESVVDSKDSLGSGGG